MGGEGVACGELAVNHVQVAYKIACLGTFFDIMAQDYRCHIGFFYGRRDFAHIAAGCGQGNGEGYVFEDIVLIAAFGVIGILVCRNQRNITDVQGIGTIAVFLGGFDAVGGIGEEFAVAVKVSAR